MSQGKKKKKKYFLSGRPGLVSRKEGKEYMCPTRLVFRPSLGKSVIWLHLQLIH